MRTFGLTRFSLKTALLPLVVAACGAFSATGFSQQYSVGLGGFSGMAGDDLFAPGAFPGLLLPGVGLDVDAIALGRPPADLENPGLALEFSVDVFATGAPGTAVNTETIGGFWGPMDQPGDIYTTAPGGPAGTNTLLWDGDGVANPGFAPPLGLLEPPGGTVPPIPGLYDELDAWDRQAVPSFGTIWFSYSMATAPVGFTGSDILLTPYIPGYDISPPALMYLPGLALGLGGGDELDALVVFDDGIVGFTPGDAILYSLGTGAPVFGAPGPYFGFGPGDVFSFSIGGGIGLYAPAVSLGLLPGDNLDALDVVPEPTASLLVALGAALLGGIRRRR